MDSDSEHNNRIHTDNLLCCVPQIPGDAGRYTVKTKGTRKT